MLESIPNTIERAVHFLFLAGKDLNVFAFNFRKKYQSIIYKETVYPILLLALLLLTVIRIYIFFRREVLKFQVYVYTNSKHEFASHVQVSPLLVIYCSLFLHTN